MGFLDEKVIEGIGTQLGRSRVQVPVVCPTLAVTVTKSSDFSVKLFRPLPDSVPPELPQAVCQGDKRRLNSACAQEIGSPTFSHRTCALSVDYPCTFVKVARRENKRTF